MSTTFMGLTLPIVSTTIGPDWATQLNAALTVIDSHDHTPGKGTAVPTTGLNINADLNMNGHSLSSLTEVRLTNPTSVLTVGSLYRGGDSELYYSDSAGTVKITNAGSVNIAGTGGFGGDFTTDGSVAAIYTTATKTFQFTQSALTGALMDHGPVLIRSAPGFTPPPQGSGKAGVTLAVDTAIATPYTLTLPAALPGQGSPLTVDNNGAVSDTKPVSCVLFSFGSSGNGSAKAYLTTFGERTTTAANEFKVNVNALTIREIRAVAATTGNGVGSFTVQLRKNGSDLGTALVWNLSSAATASAGRADAFASGDGLSVSISGTGVSTGFTSGSIGVWF